MRIVDQPRLEKWQPQLEWEWDDGRIGHTKLWFGPLLLSNSIEWAGWNHQPINPWICEECGISGCGVRNLSTVRRFNSYMIWMPPDPADYPSSQSRDDIEYAALSSSLLMPISTWRALRKDFPQLPEECGYPILSRKDLHWLWISERPADVPVPDEARLERWFLHNVIAVDPESPQDVIDKWRHVWFDVAPKKEVTGTIIQKSKFPDLLSSIFVDGSPCTEWQLFATENSSAVVIGNEWIFQFK